MCVYFRPLAQKFQIQSPNDPNNGFVGGEDHSGYKVKDISQAEFGHLKIESIEVEMPGLMAYGAEFNHA